MIAITTLYGQVIDHEVKNQKTLVKFLVLTGEHKNQVVAVETNEDYASGIRRAVTGKFVSKKRFKELMTDNTEIQDDLTIIAELAGIRIPEEDYKTYLQALGTNNLYTAADILSDPERRDIFLADNPDSGFFIGLINYVTTEVDAKGLAQVFRDAGTNLGFSHALQLAYSLKFRQGYLKKNLLELIEMCPWIISQVLSGEEVDDAIKKLEKYFKIPRKKAELYRAASIIIKILKESMNRGDCFVTRNVLYSRVLGYGISHDLYRQAFNLLCEEESSKFFARIVLDDDYTLESVQDANRWYSEKTRSAVYLPGIFFAEKWSAELYYQLSQTPAPELPMNDLLPYIRDVEKSFGQELNQSQMELIQAVCENKITLLTGEAGTGKSYALKVLAEAYYRYSEKMPVIIAPTALAAFRAAEETSLSDMAKTIHRYASIFTNDSDLVIGAPYQNKQVPQDSPGLVIIDECSMLGPVMLYKFLKRIAPYTRVVFAGDPNQLPPIGADGIFTGMIKLAKEGIGKHIHLSENYRNSEGVIQAARALLNNKPLPEVGNVFVHICKAGEIPEKILECVDLVGGINTTNTMIMAPYRRYGYHIDALNKLLSRKYGGVELIPNSEFQIGYPIMAKRNDYLEGGMPRPSTLRKMRTSRKDVLNGMKGFIKEYDPATKTVCIDYFTGIKGERIYRVEELPYYIELAYGITVHKAQGGQAANIILVLDTAMNNKNLIYTALTRCKQGGQVHIITKKEFLEAPYLNPKISEDDEFEYSSNRCLNKFKYRVLAHRNQPKKRAYK